MPTNYAEIAEINRQKYGTEVSNYGQYIADLLYSDRTHFIYELLQNAEDTEATQVEFSLFRDRVEFRHNGRPFAREDVIGICNIGRGTKAEDMTKIGKFGIGFKSVYAVTRTPIIYSGGERFSIEHYVFPREVPPVSLLKHETRIVLPFNRPDLDVDKAYSEIAYGLQEVSPQTILFLRHIAELRWEIEEGKSGHYLRDTRFTNENRLAVRIVDIIDETDKYERWMVFKRPAVYQDHDLSVEIAVPVNRIENADTETYSLSRYEFPRLVVFFPTARPTPFGFVMQGPYRTTPARDNIRSRDPLNEFLILETSKLAVDALKLLRDTRELTVESLTIFVCDVLATTDAFFPVFAAIRSALMNSPFLPTESKEYTSGIRGRLARPGSLAQLFSDAQLNDLDIGAPPLHWLSTSITLDRARLLYTYLTRQLTVQELDPFAVMRRMNAKFLQEQSDEWIRRLYIMLDRLQSVVRELIDKGTPILRLENGQHVPVRHLDRPRAYLPPEGDTQFPIVKRSICSDPAVVSFLRSKCELTEPDRMSEVLEYVLPRYEQRPVQFSVDGYLKDIEKIFSALEMPDRRRRASLLERLRGCSFLLGRNAASGEEALVAPGIIVPDHSDYSLFYAGNPEAWFPGENLAEYAEILHRFGFIKSDFVNARDADSAGYVSVLWQRGEHVRGLNHFDPDCEIDGLEFALQNPSHERSRFVWNKLLLPNKHHIRGEVEYSTRQDFTNAKRKVELSSMGRLATEYAWLPTTAGGWFKPSDLTLDELPPDFTRDEGLANQLGMRSTDLKGISQQLNVEEEVVRAFMKAFQKDPNLVRSFLSNLGQAERIPTQSSHNDRKPSEIRQEIPNVAEEMKEAFLRSGVFELTDTESELSLVPNPELRHARIVEEITTTKQLEVENTLRAKDEKDFGPVDTTTGAIQVRWEQKDPQTRNFLLEQYGGRCQICGHTFPLRKDGSPYFEGVYIARHSHGRWFDRPGNVLCLCANHAAQFLYGEVRLEDFNRSILGLRETKAEYLVPLRLCGVDMKIRFTQRHVIDIQAILQSADT
ncbi:MAG: hypothetical protein L6Q98_23005 [Anaerolineae bacterium]|nr:hypothetical protein [Anaerolineae bacterium]NUQ04750.1 hypothetical protein [Anaerolineae bacterium]